MEEIWKDIVGFEGLYQVSSLGRIRSVDRVRKGKKCSTVPLKGKIIKPYVTIKNNYAKIRVTLYKDCKQYKYFVSVLVAKTFSDICGEWFEGCEVHHKDRNPYNNSPFNIVVLSHQDHLKQHTERKKNKDNPLYGTHLSQETKQKISLTKSKPIYQLDLQGKIVKEWQSCTECEKINNYHRAAINRCCRGKQKTAYGYKWKYKDAA